MIDSEQQPRVDEAAGLSFSEQDGVLWLALAPDVPCTREIVLAAMAEAGYGDWRLKNAELEDLLASQAAAEDELSGGIAERVDGRFTVSVSADALEARLDLEPPAGGEPVTEEALRAALEAQEIRHGLLWGDIRDALAAQRAQGLLIARGEAAQRGEDARFVSLLRAKDGRQPKIDNAGRADFHELDAFLTVDPGDWLMRRIPARPGRGGVDVHGRALPAEAGRDSPYSGGLRGTVIAENDPNLLLAEIGGLPTVMAQGVRVDPVIAVESITMATGNLDFDGVVNVRGDVDADMRVNATGDVFVGGTVEGAEIVAGGDVEVKGSIVGHGNVRDERGRLNPHAARIRCAGTLRARLLKNAWVEAGASVRIGTEIAHCEVLAGEEITVGRRGVDKAQVVGGELRATRRVATALLGSPAGVATRVLVGQDPGLWQEHTELQAQIDSARARREELAKAVQHLVRQQDERRLAPAREALNTLMEQLRGLEARQQELKGRLTQAEGASIVASRCAYANVELNIGGHSHRLREEHPGGEFILREARIVLK